MMRIRGPAYQHIPPPAVSLRLPFPTAGVLLAMPPPVEDEQPHFLRTSRVVQATRSRPTQATTQAAPDRTTYNIDDSVYSPPPPTRRLNYVGQSLALHRVFPRGSPLVSMYDSDSPPRNADDSDSPTRNADEDPRAASEESDSDDSMLSASTRSWDSDAIRQASRERAEERRRLYGSALVRIRSLRAAETLADDTLYLNDCRPPQSPAMLIDAFKCSICLEILSHPVAYRCGHTHCYVCIRRALQRSLRCPICNAVMEEAPYRHYAFEQAIGQVYPEWVDSSDVPYTFPTLDT
ncbi:hypothetical protein C8F01DRAFT_1136984 [Mycena amicta]|nr:hypothetical protein C8F01DRAFT_1136984 [Mycena amicta]